MAVRLETSIRRFIGLSTDEKPVPGVRRLEDDHLYTAADIPAGSTLLETDRGWLWHYDGERWVRAAPDTSMEVWAAAILAELASIREAIIEGLA